MAGRTATILLSVSLGLAGCGPSIGEATRSSANDRLAANAGQGRQSASHKPASTPSEPPPGPLCILDDSGDMGRHFTTPVAPNEAEVGTWSLVHYVFKGLQCEKCCYWSVFAEQGTACVPGLCDVESPKPRPKQQKNPDMSPVLNVFDRIANGHIEVVRPLYLVTNGVDWTNDQGNCEAGKSVDVGERMATWLQQDAERSVVLGGVRDLKASVPTNTSECDAKRVATLMLAGFVPAHAAVPAARNYCELSFEALPQQFEIRASLYRLQRYMAGMRNCVAADGKCFVDFSGQGVATLTAPWPDPTTTLTATVYPKGIWPGCLTLLARLGAGDRPTTTQLGNNVGVVHISFPLGDEEPASFTMGLDVVPDWRAQLLPVEADLALGRSFRTFRARLRQPLSVRLNGGAAQPVTNLTVQKAHSAVSISSQAAAGD